VPFGPEDFVRRLNLQSGSDKAPKKISLLLTDVDGTLVTQEKELTAAAKAAVKQLTSAGVKFAITSGRPPAGMSMLVEPLQITSPIAAFNGGVFVRPDLSIIEQRTLPKDVAEKAIAIVKSSKLDCWLYRGSDWYVPERHGSHVDREEWTVKFPPIVTNDYSKLTEGVAKIVGVSDDLEAVKACEADLQKELGERASAARSQPYYVDITHPQANKGGVVDMLSVFFKIERAEIATIGDMPNDVLMFKRSGMSVAMGNASPEVQKQATYVTDSNQQEGFAHAIDKFILPQLVKSS
jgi:Cof subfamily protein (haloacid dehalogenase superfamily)